MFGVSFKNYQIIYKYNIKSLSKLNNIRVQKSFLIKNNHYKQINLFYEILNITKFSNSRFIYLKYISYYI